MNRRQLVCGVLAFVIGQLIGMESAMGMGLAVALIINGIRRVYLREDSHRSSPFFVWGIILFAILGIMNGVRCNLKDDFLDQVEQISNTKKVYLNTECTILRIEPRDSTVVLELRLESAEPDPDQEREMIDVLKTVLYSTNHVHKYHIRCYLHNYYEDLRIGDKLNCRMQVKVPASPTNPGEFNNKVYYSARGIDLIGYADSYHVSATEKGRIRQSLYQLRSDASMVYTKVLDPKHAGILQTMILGLSSQMDSDIREMYQRNGIAHILAISALHITILGSALYKMLRKIGLPYTAAGIPVILLLTGYGWMTGFSSSTIRAVMMFVLLLIGDMIGRTYDMLTAAAASCICMLLEYPIRIYDTAFLLSFSAVMTLGVIVPKCLEFVSSFHLWSKSLLTGVILQLITAPVILHFYYELPLYGWLLNLIVVPLMTPLFICGILGLFGYMIHPMIGEMILMPCGWILSLYTWLCEHMERLPFSAITLGFAPVWKIVLYYAMLFGIYLLWKYKKWMLVFLEICVFTGFLFLTEPHGLDITMLDIGQGDSVLLRLPDRKIVLMDGGSSSRTAIGKYVITPAIKYNGSDHIDYVFVSHMDSDHVNGILELIESRSYSGIRIRNLVLPSLAEHDESFIPLLQAASEADITVFLMNEMDSLNISGVEFECLYPDSDGCFSNDTNNNSMVISVTYQDFDMLFTGDLESEGEKLIMDRYDLIPYDVLKVGHHGSSGASSKQFLQEVHPKIAMISCGAGNSYGHPHAETLERLKNEESLIYRTDQNGAITLHIHLGRITVQTYNVR
ncbi:MAG: DNA internalization-related competence protein ComEC/Rec2 [Lachnospiraceae bacterium]|nr:DNA internalization-related competence protein ComEC/Rec2 [Lachnospiraceae bacterium]